MWVLEVLRPYHILNAEVLPTIKKTVSYLFGFSVNTNEQNPSENISFSDPVSFLVSTEKDD